MTSQTTTELAWAKFSRQIRAFIARRVSDPQDVDDLLQEVFVKVHARIDTLRQESRLAPWLYRIARNVVLDHYRKRRPTAPLEEELPAAEEPTAVDAEKEIADSLLSMLECLPEAYRRPVTMYELEGLKQEEIGRQLGISLSGAKSRIQRGREMLRNELLDCCHVQFDRTGHIVDYEERQQCCNRCGLEGSTC